jgi:hypothetical protein
MAQKQVSQYDLDDVFLTLDGERIRHGGDGSLVEFEPESEFQTTSVSADGFVTVNRNKDDRLNCSIIVMQSSPAFDTLWSILKDQRENDRYAVPFLMTDVNKETEIKSEEVIFDNYPHPNKEEEVSEVTFELTLPYAAGQLQFG